MKTTISSNGPLCKIELDDAITVNYIKKKSRVNQMIKKSKEFQSGILGKQLNDIAIYENVFLLQRRRIGHKFMSVREPLH